MGYQIEMFMSEFLSVNTCQAALTAAWLVVTIRQSRLNDMTHEKNGVCGNVLNHEEKGSIDNQ